LSPTAVKSSDDSKQDHTRRHATSATQHILSDPRSKVDLQIPGNSILMAYLKRKPII